MAAEQNPHFSTLPSFAEESPAAWEKSAVKVSERGSKQVYTNRPGTRGSPAFYLPEMQTPFGARPPKEGNGRPSVDLSVTDENLKQWLQALDSANVDYIVHNSMEIFNVRQPRSREMVSELHTAMAKYSDKYPDYPPLLRVKLNVNGRNPTKILIVTGGTLAGGDLQAYEGTMEDVTPFSRVQAEVKAEGFWFIQNGSGFTFSASRLLVWPGAGDEPAPINGLAVVPRPDIPAGPGPEPEMSMVGGGSGEGVTFVREGDEGVEDMET